MIVMRARRLDIRNNTRTTSLKGTKINEMTLVYDIK